MKYTVKISDVEVEVEAKQWNGQKFGKDFGSQVDAENIVAWVNANGGDARYDHRQDTVGRTRIAVRTINGWHYAAPGHYVVMSSEWFNPNDGSGPRKTGGVLRDFYPVTDLSEVRHLNLGKEKL